MAFVRASARMHHDAREVVHLAALHGLQSPGEAHETPIVPLGPVLLPHHPIHHNEQHRRRTLPAGPRVNLATTSPRAEPVSITEVSVRWTSSPWRANVRKLPPDDILQFARPAVREKSCRKHFQLRRPVALVRNRPAQLAPSPLAKRNSANVLLECRALPVRATWANGEFRGAQNPEGLEKQLRGITLPSRHGKLWHIEQTRARGAGQRSNVVDPPALHRQSRGLRPERAQRTRLRVQGAMLVVNGEKPTDGSHAQQHLRDGAHEASVPQVANSHDGPAAAVPLQLPGHVPLAHAVDLAA